MRLTKYILLAVFCLFFFAVALFPANLAWKLVPQNAQRSLPVKVEQVGGTLWDGFVLVNNPRGPVRGKLSVAWEFHPLSLLGLNLALTLKVQGEGFDVGGRGHVGLGGYGIQALNGNLAAELVNGALASQGVKASGDLQLRDVSLVVSGAAVDSAGGELTWDGGPVSYRQGRTNENFNFPAIVGSLKEVEGGIALNVIETKGKQALADLTVTADAVGGIKVYQRVLKLAGMGSNGPDDKVLLGLQRPLPMTWENPIPQM